MAEPKHFLDLDRSIRKRSPDPRSRQGDEKQRANGATDRAVGGKTLAMIFEKSLDPHPRVVRGRHALLRASIMLGRTDTQLRRGETIADTARVPEPLRRHHS